MSLEQMRKLLTAENAELAAQAGKPRADTSVYPHWEMAPNAKQHFDFFLMGTLTTPSSGLNEMS